MIINRSFRYAPGALSTAIMQEMHAWEVENKIARLWQCDSSLWTSSDENKMMGWLNAPGSTIDDFSKIQSFIQQIWQQHYRDVVLLGMGGSSLCPDVLAKIFGKIQNYPRFHVLDSIDTAQILHLENNINLKNTIFIVSSKSGTTLEPILLKKYFFSRLQDILGTMDVGEHFVAITDPGSPLEQTARLEKFKAIFYGIPSVIGRLSALSNFGIVPLSLMGIDTRALLSQAEKMKTSCYESLIPTDNPGVALGIILGVSAKKGKDKVTLIISSAIYPFGEWIVQLLAESTGKDGKGLIPIAQEPLASTRVYGDDRLFVYIRLGEKPDPHQDYFVTQLEEHGHVIVQVDVADKISLGAEMFRWQMATAVASSIVGIHPFNQPDVETCKVRTIELALKFEKEGQVLLPDPIFSEHGMQLFTDNENASVLSQLIRGESTGIASYLKAHLSRGNLGDYVDLLAFIAMTDEHLTLLQDIRCLIRDRKKLATCVGFGPRFLHSTGQLHKGGPNKGIFLQITADSSSDLQIPTHGYSFGLAIAMQAQADFEVLTQRSRRFLRVHLGKNPLENLKKIVQLLQDI